MYLYFKNNELAMRSETKIIAPNFDEVKITLKKDEKDKLERNWKGRLVDGKLELEISPQEKSDKEKKDKEDLVVNTKQAIENAKDINDIKKLLENFLCQ